MRSKRAVIFEVMLDECFARHIAHATEDEVVDIVAPARWSQPDLLIAHNLTANITLILIPTKCQCGYWEVWMSCVEVCLGSIGLSYLDIVASHEILLM